MKEFMLVKNFSNRLMLFKRKDFRTVETSFCFLDETGLLYAPRDRFFAIGLIKCKKPEEIYNKIRCVRNKYNYREEIKWSKLDTKIRFDLARELFDIFLVCDVKFNCIILDKKKMDFDKHFHGDLYKAYTSFSVALMKLVIGKDPEEVLVVLADNYFAPLGKDIEEKTKKFVNDHYQEFVVAGVCQIDSKSSDLLQLTDLILGAVIYDLKKNSGMVDILKSPFKRKFLNYLYQKLQIQKSFFLKNGFKTSNYILSGDKLRATIFDCGRSRATKFKRE